MVPDELLDDSTVVTPPAPPMDEVAVDVVHRTFPDGPIARAVVPSRGEE